MYPPPGPLPPSLEKGGGSGASQLQREGILLPLRSEERKKKKIPQNPEPVPTNATRYSPPSPPRLTTVTLPILENRARAQVRRSKVHPARTALAPGRSPSSPRRLLPSVPELPLSSYSLLRKRNHNMLYRYAPKALGSKRSVVQETNERND